ncbi:protein SENSITIVE TO PROTON RHIZOTOXICITY 2-like [Rutidosis leptorrhynchoides]|uniref:protein SENSITIVE TO PROTON RHIZOTOXICITY 2-like n=1 Tax=Rutidosis leptorrhynchoides TaxID=125765 RepID=UPI003A9A51C2
MNPNATSTAADAATDDGLHHSLANLSNVRSRMDNVHRFLVDSLNSNTIISQAQMDIVSNEISAAINQVIVNGAAIISFTGLPNSTGLTFDSRNLTQPDLKLNNLKNDVHLGFPKTEFLDDEIGGDCDIVELDAVELLAEHLHFCEFCGKGFKRDANLRMHMRAHGNKYKTLEALSKPEKSGVGTDISRGGRTRFSCPFTGCSRNKLHKKFRPLKSVICVKNHFKRSHCPKMYSCNRCHKKNFSVLADLKSHLKHCGETKWKCSCGTSFSRKDKLFGHIALFEGHMPAMPAEDVAVAVAVEDEEKVKAVVPSPLVAENRNNKMDDVYFDGLFDGLGSIDDEFCMQDLYGAGSNGGMDWNL